MHKKFDLNPGAHVHFLGICGTAMASVAGLMQSKGFKVTGSDQNVYPPMSTQLADLGIEIKEGYKKENLSPRPDLAIVGNIMSPKAEESVELMAQKIPAISMPQAIGEYVIEDRTSLVAAGTHGKTTTTAMLAWVAKVCGKDPGFMVGGIPKNFPRSFQDPKGDVFVIEGDEYETCFLDKGSKFMHYRPHGVVLHQVEMDHIEYFETFENLKNAFRKFLELIPVDGHLVYNGECETNQELVKGLYLNDAKSFGWTKGDFQIANFEIDGVTTKFDITYKGKKEDRATLNVLGDYNALNATAAYALARAYDWERPKILEALESFAGVKRRQEVIGQPNNIIVIDDFAHHPTAVNITIDSIQKRFPQAHVFSIFEPRSATSCRAIFAEPYFQALKQAQTAVLVPPNAFREIAPGEELNVPELVERLKGAGVDAHQMQEVDAVVKFVQSKAKPGDVVLLMSNGAFGGIYTKMLDALA